MSKEKKSDWPELEKALCLSMAFPNISDEFERKMAETGQGVGRGVLAALFHRAFAAFAATFFGEIQFGSWAFLSEIVLAFEWGKGVGDYAQIESQIHGSHLREGHATSVGLEEVYEHLVAYVFRLICQPGKKVLTIGQLAKELDKS